MDETQGCYHYYPTFPSMAWVCASRRPIRSECDDPWEGAMCSAAICSISCFILWKGWGWGGMGEGQQGHIMIQRYISYQYHIIIMEHAYSSKGGTTTNHSSVCTGSSMAMWSSASRHCFRFSVSSSCAQSAVTV